jgi:RecA/RadA recombinase
MELVSGYAFYKENSKFPLISSGDSKLDELLRGGLHRELIYLLYGSKKITSNILHSAAVSFQKGFLDDGLGGRIAYIDATNKFSPYKISTLALSMRLNPSQVLDNIFISRAFTWSQMVEILEKKLLKFGDIRMVLVSGITKLFESYEQRTFEDLSRAINGIKKVAQKTKALVVITAPLHECSYVRVKGGNILSHFANVLVLINDEDRFTEYHLIQHPYLPNKKVVKWKPRKQKVDESKTLKNTTLDLWLS